VVAVFVSIGEVIRVWPMRLFCGGSVGAGVRGCGVLAPSSTTIISGALTSTCGDAWVRSGIDRGAGRLAVLGLVCEDGGLICEDGGRICEEVTGADCSWPKMTGGESSISNA